MSKFSVGQIVRLNSKSTPHLNGLHTINAVSKPLDNAVVERTMQPTKETLYSLVGIEGWYVESALSVNR